MVFHTPLILNSVYKRLIATLPFTLEKAGDANLDRKKP